MTRTTFAAACVVALGLSAPAIAQQQESLTIDLNAVTAEGVGDKMGTLTIQPAADGAGTAFTVRAQGFSQGEHGFHVHQNASCEPADGTPGGAAGGHWDPGNTGTHRGPTGEGHLGDLPALEADADGSIDQVVTAPRIQDMAELRGHAVIIHQGGDTYSDEPNLGGGGARVACGIIPES